jgi:hypothetical protein
MPNKKTAKKTPKQKPSPRSGVALPAGAHPKNTGGKKGRSGAKPKAFKEFCNAILMDPTVQDKIRALAEGGEKWAVELAAKYTQKQPAQDVDVTFNHEKALEELDE